MTGYVIAVLVITGLVAVYLLLVRITEEGGRSGRDPTAIANQILAEADTFRGSRSPDDPAWDGENRLARPTSEGLPLWPVAPRPRDDPEGDRS